MPKMIRGAGFGRRVVSYCSVCRQALLTTQDLVWQRAGATGLTHAACATDPDAAPVDPQRITTAFPAP